ncbi:hypothetical protein KY327_00170 [Candidatus Woesearchaeota archaeon]|nr:hypothetical protein [Candidatus Woesearchaeota archaeon]
MKEAFIKAARGLWKAFPLIAGTMLLVGLLTTLVPREAYAAVFGTNAFLDVLIGSLSGSVAAGNAATSYIIGGELQGSGVGLLAVTAFITSWVTVGVVQLPAEASILGKRFALARNALSFLLSFIVALATVTVVGLL